MRHLPIVGFVFRHPGLIAAFVLGFVLRSIGGTFLTVALSFGVLVVLVMLALWVMGGNTESKVKTLLDLVTLSLDRTADFIDRTTSPDSDRDKSGQNGQGPRDSDRDIIRDYGDN